MLCWHRDCPICRPKLVKREIERFDRASAAGGTLRQTTVKDEDWQAATKRFSRAGIKWRRFPQPNEENVVILDGDDDHLDLSELPEDREDWVDSLLLSIPENKRISGKLGEEEKDDDEDENSEGGDTIEILVQPIGSSLDRYETNEAQQIAISVTSDLCPRTAEELQAAINAREDAFREVVEALGGSGCWYNMPPQKRNVKIASLSWNDKEPIETVEEVEDSNQKAELEFFNAFVGLP
jgi:hypothetical protein